MVEKYIQQLLYTQECVVIPGFGGLLARYHAATVHPITHRFTPPHKSLAFNAALQQNDNLLLQAIVLGENISRTQAQEALDAYLKEVQGGLRTNSFYIMPEIGRFYLNPENQVQFEAEAKINYLETSYGLSEFTFKPVLRDNVMANYSRPVRPVVKRKTEQQTAEESGQPKTEVKTPKTKVPAKEGKSGGMKLVLVLVPLLILVAAAGYVVWKKQQDGTTQAGIMSTEMGKTKEKENKSEEAIPSDSNTNVKVNENEEANSPSDEVENAPEVEGQAVTDLNPEVALAAPAKEAPLIEKAKRLEKQAQINGDKTGKNQRYFVIVGSFVSRENAMKFRNKILKYGPNATVLEPSKTMKYYKVAIDDYDNKSAAEKRKNEVNHDFSNSWVMAY